MAFKAFLISWPVVVGWAGWVSWTVINHGERLVAVETILAKVP